MSTQKKQNEEQTAARAKKSALEEHTPAKRTQREIRRMAQMTKMVLDLAKKLGPGADRHVAFMTTVRKLAEWKPFPSWRKAYVQGYAEGASAILFMIAEGVIEMPVHGVQPTNGHAEPAHAPARARAMKRLPDAIPSTLPPPPPVPVEDPMELMKRALAALGAITPRT